MGVGPGPRFDGGLDGIKTGIFGFGHIKTGSGDFEVKHLENGRTGDPGKFRFFAAHIVRNGPSGPVSPQCQRDPRFLTRDNVI